MTEVMVNGPDDFYVKLQGRIEKVVTGCSGVCLLWSIRTVGPGPQVDHRLGWSRTA